MSNDHMDLSRPLLADVWVGQARTGGIPLSYRRLNIVAVLHVRLQGSDDRK